MKELGSSQKHQWGLVQNLVAVVGEKGWVTWNPAYAKYVRFCGETENLVL